jgi:hypothetical protein
MAYDLHLEREPAITLSEWESAVSRVGDVRLGSGGSTIVNPKSGDVIAVGGVEGDAEVNAGGGWHSFFRWQPSGSISFPYTEDLNAADSSVRRIVADLASILDAQVVGDEGESYDLGSTT